MRGCVGYMALKLDMSKAYDRFELSFLEEIMRRLGFAEHWISLIMTCVTIVSYSILINGQPHRHIVPTRGIRQCDLLSPHLFNLCVEGLSNLILRAEMNHRLSGLLITRGGTKVSHLFFADDNLMFCRANIFEWIKVQEILIIYEKALGQKINWDKTSIFFNKNTKIGTREHLLTVSGVSSTSCYDKYLGLQTLVGWSRTDSFQSFLDRIWNRLNGWKERFLSQAGKEVLLKAVIQAIPTYTTSIFQLPKVLCKKINSMMERFWWGHKENLNRTAWLS